MEHRSLRFKQVASTGILLVAAVIWGMCFVAQRSGMEHIGPFLFNGLREILGSLTLLVVLLVVWLVTRARRAKVSRNAGENTAELFENDTEEYGVIVEPGFQVKPEDEDYNQQHAPQASKQCTAQAGKQSNSQLGKEGASQLGKQKNSKTSMKYIVFAGLACGLALFCASNLQQVGMVSVTASKAAFITTLYIVLVPILGIFLRHKTHWNTWVSVGIAVVGLYLLCAGDSLALEPGDAVLLVGAFFWAVHILAVGHFAPRLSIVQLFGMCVIQFALAGVLSLIAAYFLDYLFVPAAVTLEALIFVTPELLYAGILSTAVAFTLMAVGQRYAKPTPAAIVMSTESVFGLLGGVFLLGEMLTPIESLGCVLMLAAVILTQLDFGKHKRGDPTKASVLSG